MWEERTVGNFFYNGPKPAGMIETRLPGNVNEMCEQHFQSNPQQVSYSSHKH